jgi:hypothetical protein
MMSLLALSYEEEHEQGSDALGIADFARGDKSRYLVRGNSDQLDIVGILSYETSGHKVGSHKAMEVLRAIAGSGVKATQFVYLPGEIANLFL